MSFWFEVRSLRKDDAMFVRDIYERFAKKAPVSVMVRATIENVLAPSRLNSIFEENAEKQYAGDLLFSTVADLRGLALPLSETAPGVLSLNGPLLGKKKMVPSSK